MNITKANKAKRGGMLDIWLVEGNINIAKANNKNIVVIANVIVEEEWKLVMATPIYV
jgi:hypothetical protein